MEQGVAENPLREMKFGAVLGSRQFVEWFQEKVKAKRDDREVSQLAKAKPRVSLAAISELVAERYAVSEEVVRCRDRKLNEARDVAIYLSRQRSGCPLREIGAHFGGIRPSAVSLAHKRIEEKLRKNRRLRETVSGAALALDQHQTSKM